MACFTERGEYSETGTPSGDHCAHSRAPGLSELDSRSGIVADKHSLYCRLVGPVLFNQLTYAVKDNAESFRKFAGSGLDYPEVNRNASVTQDINDAVSLSGAEPGSMPNMRMT